MAGNGWHRVPVDPQTLAWARTTGEPGIRCHQRDVDDGHLTVLVAKCTDPSFDAPRWHLSISHRTNAHPPQPGRLPTWEEIAEARYRFVPDEAQMALFLPPRAEYVNVHETTMQMWEVPPHD